MLPFTDTIELTWTDSTPLPDATAGIAFNSWNDVKGPLVDSVTKYTGLVGDKYLSIGGGNHYGRWAATALHILDDAIASGRLSQYSGVCYDMEEGDAGLAALLEASFASAKAHGRKVLVTVSDSVPYDVSDGVDLMNTMISCGHVDYVSPQ